MNMKKLIIYSLLTLVGFGFASCEDFLNKLPDQRAEIELKRDHPDWCTNCYYYISVYYMDEADVFLAQEYQKETE